MSSQEQDRDPMGQVLKLSSGCDPSELSLTAAEGFLLSRIDGVTPWRLLREMGGVPASEVDACLERWLSEGLLDVVGGSRSPAGDRGPGAAASEPQTDAASVPPAADFVPVIDESALDDRLELDVAVQRRILEFEASLSRPYHELLGVERGAEPKVVKRAYFKLSKEFHPDRYFRREIGSYGARLDRIFKKVLEAHEMLSDPELCQVENQPEPGTGAADAAVAPPEVAAPPAAEPSSAPRTLTKLERLRQRMPFKINHAALAQRRAKADEIFRAARVSQSAGRLAEAEANIRIAISFDPMRAEFKEALGAMRIEAAGSRAAKLLEQPSDLMSDSELREALTLLEDVLMYRPHDERLNERAARVCLQLGMFSEAEEFAETLVEGHPESGPYHSLLGRAYRGQQKREEALRAFETALKYDGNDSDARRAIAAMRIGHHDAVQGGRA